MTLPEKIGQMHAHWLILSADGDHRLRTDPFCQTASASDLREMLKVGVGQITRPLGSHPVSPKEGVRALNKLQKFLVEETRLGIPAMSHEECLVGLMIKGATLFPSGLNYGSTWNPELIEEVGQEIRKEAKQIGCHQGLAPVLDVSRDVRWAAPKKPWGGSLFGGSSCHSLRKRLARGVRDFLATLKHYAGHSFSEGPAITRPSTLVSEN
jgi:beta-glucosidase